MTKDNYILVVEDCDEDYDTMLQALHNTGLDSAVYRATSGLSCLALLRDVISKAQRPGLILMDLNMPGIGGIEVLREIKSDVDLRFIPVVVFTTSSNPRDLNDCYSYGANACHLKPFHYPDYITLIENILRYWLLYVVRLENTEVSQKGQAPAD